MLKDPLGCSRGSQFMTDRDTGLVLSIGLYPLRVLIGGFLFYRILISSEM